jgi:hypothetical protein
VRAGLGGRGAIVQLDFLVHGSLDIVLRNSIQKGWKFAIGSENNM